MLKVPMGWDWAVWFVQQMLEHLLPDEAGETTLRHLSPPQSTLLLRWTCRRSRQMNLKHACWDVWRLLPGVVARAEPSSDALLGFELIDSGTCWRPSPKKLWRIALALWELA